MTPDQVLDIAHEAIFVLIKLGAPIMLVALVVGVQSRSFRRSRRCRR
jgi:flagellar biosynthesis protein FliQ